ncbi:MAG: hypothetical protein PHQ40_14850 [Anaerolineaceae bacterium]|nr:hypothetical protein [Anaerolineaceae bacterium]
MNLLSPTLLIASVATTAILFAIVAFFSRAGLRRIVGSLLAAIPVIPMVMFYDKIAARFGWWHYPSVTAASAPLAWYVAAALGYGAAFGLIGWRVIRRWQIRGLLAFLLLFALFGVARDYGYSVTTRFLVFGHGLVPLLADLFAYGSSAAVVQLLMRWIVGSAQSDVLARTP